MGKLLLERWNDDLAVRLPDEMVTRLGIKDGDQIDVATFEAELEKQFGAASRITD